MLWLQLPSLKKTLRGGVPGCGHLPAWNPTQLVRPCWALRVHEDAQSRVGRAGRARNYTEETAHSGERGRREGKESFWEAPGNQKSPKCEEGQLVEAKGKAPAYFLMHSGLSSCLEKKCFQNVFGEFLFIYKLEQVLRLSHSNSSFKSGFPRISALGFTLWR